MKIEKIMKTKENAILKLCVKAGTALDFDGKEGIAHLIEHVNLLFDKYSKYEHITAYGYTDFFSTTYFIETMDNEIYLFRALEIINKIINGWFIKINNIDIAKSDIKKEITTVESNYLVQQIIKDSAIANKDPRNKNIDIDMIKKTDLLDFVNKYYISRNCLLIIESDLDINIIDRGKEIFLQSNINKISTPINLPVNNLKWNTCISRDDNKKLLFKIKNNFSFDDNGLIEILFIKWILNEEFYKLTSKENNKVIEVLFSPYEIIFIGNYDNIFYNNFPFKMKSINSEFLHNNENFLLILNKLCKEKINISEMKEKEFLYNRKLFLSNRSFSYAKNKFININYGKIMHKITQMFKEENILII